MSAADALVDRLPPAILVVGKGGVGKTTCAAALALQASRRTDTLVLSTDPAKALPTVLDQRVESTPTRIDYAKQLSAQMLDADRVRSEFIARWGDTIRTILDRGTYLDESDIGPLVDTALPGSDEIFGALELARLLAENGDRRLVVDTAPTGHTLRLLNLPRTFRALVRLLDAMQGKHRFMVRTLTRRYRPDEADAFLTEMTGKVSNLDTTLRDSKRCAAVLVTNQQSLVVEETRRYVSALNELSVQIAAIVWNNAEGPPQHFEFHSDGPVYFVPHLEVPPVGRQGLERWLDALRPLDVRPHEARSRKSHGASFVTAQSHAADVAPLLRPLTIVAGKGGVGKTTVAAALALHSAFDKRTLVVSTDPAPSLADAFEQDIPDADVLVNGEQHLFARQMDASAAFTRLREEYQARVDALFAALTTRGVDLTQDRAIARDLFSLAPPGIDEVYGLSLIADALFERNYERVLVDPAPTGHLLRLLEMPQLALAWSHQLLRLMLKYKEVMGLGDAARDVLEFAKNLRALDALLHDQKRSAVVLVALDELVVRAETERLVGSIHARGIRISGLVVNRMKDAPSQALPVVDGAVHFEAPSVEPPPVGTNALRRWLTSWRKPATNPE